MASQIYTRYIPPKETTEQVPPTSAPSSSPTSNPASSANSNSLYTRYIPPKRKLEKGSDASLPPKRLKIVSLNPESSTPKIGELQTPADVEIAKANTTESMAGIKGEKKHKKEKKREKQKQPKDPKLEEIPQDEPEESSKHIRMLKKREKSLRKAERRAAEDGSLTVHTENEISPGNIDEEGDTQLHQLVPLPQPELLPEPIFTSLNTSLPAWLASPIHASPTASATFEELGILPDVAHRLQARKLEKALAIQSAVSAQSCGIVNLGNLP